MLHLSRLWDFCHSKFALVAFYIYQGYLILLKTKEFIILSKNNIYLVILSSQKMYHFFSSKIVIHGNANAGHARCRGHKLPYKISIHNPIIKAHFVLQFIMICCFAAIFAIYIWYREVAVDLVRYHDQFCLGIWICCAIYIRMFSICVSDRCET